MDQEEEIKLTYQQDDVRHDMCVLNVQRSTLKKSPVLQSFINKGLLKHKNLRNIKMKSTVTPESWKYAIQIIIDNSDKYLEDVPSHIMIGVAIILRELQMTKELTEICKMMQ